MRITHLLTLSICLSLVACATGKGEEETTDGDVTGEDGGVGGDGGGDGADGADGGGDGSDGADGGSGDGSDGSDGADGGGSDGGTGDDPLDCDPAGRGYRLDLGGADFVEPAGIGGLLGSLLSEDWLLGVSSASGSDIEFEMAFSTGLGEAQDYCSPTVAFPAADFSTNPAFVLGPQDTTLSLVGTEITIAQLELSGKISADCGSMEDGRLAGQIDVRDLGDLFSGLTGSTDAAVNCATLASFGASCQACLSDGAELCLGLDIQNLEGNEDGESSVECVPDEDCHEMCPSSDGSDCAC